MKTELVLLPQTKFANIFAMQRYVELQKENAVSVRLCLTLRKTF